MRSKFLPWSLLLVTLVAACSGGDAVETMPTPSVTVSPTPSVPTRPAASGNPLTGLAPVAGPVVAIKIDNGQFARPYHRGMDQAALIYQELVEAGATRFVAIYQSKAATKETGPIRSARESDIELLRAFGTPALGFSGANSGLMKIIAAAARAGYLRDASYDSAPSVYRLGEYRRDARNFFVVPARLGAKRGGSEPRDIGLRFGAVGTGVPTVAAKVGFAKRSFMAVAYDARKGTWTLSEAGRVIPVAPANVVIQFVRVKSGRFSDVNGKNSPYTVTTGTGRVVILRDGQRFSGTWRRAGFGATAFLNKAGQDILLKPGPTWVMLVPTTGSATFS